MLNKDSLKTTEEIGRKDDAGKPRADLLVPEFLEEMAAVLTMGAEKYSENSWKYVENAVPRYTAALYRHLWAAQKNELIDSESNLSHYAHIAVNAMFLYYFASYISVQSCPGRLVLGAPMPDINRDVDCEVSDDFWKGHKDGLK